MKRLLLISILLLTSCSSTKEYTIYTIARPPFSMSGIIDADKNFYEFTNAYPPALKHNCDLLAGPNGTWCFIDQKTKAEIINKDIIKVGDGYWCSEDHIKKRNDANPKYIGNIDYGYGICTEDGWLVK